MDLTDYLKLVFSNKLPDEYEEMVDELNRLGIGCVKDLKYFDETASTELKAFTRIEAKKLTDWAQNPDLENLEILLMKIFDGISYDRLQETKLHLKKFKIFNRTDLLSITENPLNNRFFSEAEIKKIKEFIESNSGTLEHILKKIFSGTPRNRLIDIHDILKKNEVYSGKDILILNTFELKKQGCLSDPEIRKIEKYLEKNAKERYDDLREENKLESKKKFMEFESQLKIKEQFCNSMIAEKTMLLNDISDLTRKSTQMVEHVTETSHSSKFLFIKVFKSHSVTRYQVPAFTGESRVQLMKLMQEKTARVQAIDQDLKQMAAIQFDVPSNNAIQLSLLN